MQQIEGECFPALSYMVPPIELALVKLALCKSELGRASMAKALNELSQVLWSKASGLPIAPFLCAEAIDDLRERLDRVELLLRMAALEVPNPPERFVVELRRQLDREVPKSFDASGYWQISKNELDEIYDVPLTSEFENEQVTDHHQKWQPVEFLGGERPVTSEEIEEILSMYFRSLGLGGTESVHIARGLKGPRRYSWNVLEDGCVEYHTPSDLPFNLFLLWDIPHNLAHIAHLVIASEGGSLTFTDTPRSRFYYEAVATLAEHDLAWVPHGVPRYYRQIRENETIMRRTRFEAERRVYLGLGPDEAIETIVQDYSVDRDSVRAAWRSHSSVFGIASSFYAGPRMIKKSGLSILSAIQAGRITSSE